MILIRECFTCGRAGTMLPSMLLIAAALAEELETALNLCGGRHRIRCAGVSLWTGTRAGETIHLLKTGTGPVRSAEALQRALDALDVTRVLAVGYGGALDPALKYGDLVVVDRAHSVSAESWGSPLEKIRLGASWTLADAEGLTEKALAAGLPARCGSALTVPSILGDPMHKEFMFRRFQTAVVDMETAAVAGVAAASGVPLSCVRAITDEANDDFLAPFSYQPGAGLVRRAARTMAAGNWIRRYGEWRERSLAARKNLQKFLQSFPDFKIS